MLIKMRPRGFEPLTYGLETSSLEIISALESISYNTTKKHLITNLTENNIEIQHNLTKLINRWASLPSNVKTAIIVLIGGDENE